MQSPNRKSSVVSNNNNRKSIVVQDLEKSPEEGGESEGINSGTDVNINLSSESDLNVHDSKEKLLVNLSRIMLY